MKLLTSAGRLPIALRWLIVSAGARSRSIRDHLEACQPAIRRSGGLCHRRFRHRPARLEGIRSAVRHPATEYAQSMDSNLLVSMLGLALMIAILLVIIWNEYRSWAAERRAERLVEHFLTPQELAHLRRRGYLDVKSQAIPGRFYRIPIDPGMVAVI